jgi:hypothetical protein
MKITRVNKLHDEIIEGTPVIVDWNLGGSFPVEVDKVHGYTMSTEVVADGLGFPPELILQKRSILTEGLHYLTKSTGKKGKQDDVRWTRPGVVTLSLLVGDSFNNSSFDWDFAVAASADVFFDLPESALDVFNVPDDFGCNERLGRLLNEQRLIRELLYNEAGISGITRNLMEEAEGILEEAIKPLKCKAEFFEDLLEGGRVYSVRSVGDILNFGLSRDGLFQEFRKRGFLVSGGSRHNLPHRHWIVEGFFTDGIDEFITFRGMRWIWEDFQKNPIESVRTARL